MSMSKNNKYVNYKPKILRFQITDEFKRYAINNVINPCVPISYVLYIRPKCYRQRQIKSKTKLQYLVSVERCILF